MWYLQSALFDWSSKLRYAPFDMDVVKIESGVPMPPPAKVFRRHPRPPQGRYTAALKAMKAGDSFVFPMIDFGCVYGGARKSQASSRDTGIGE